jgi:L-asparaginase II
VPPVPLVRVVRSGLEESVHLGSVAVADARGRLLSFAGDPHRVAYARSSMKPLQASISLTLAGDELPDREVAVMCGSHNGEPVHLEAVRAILARADLGFEVLQTPASLPIDQEAAVRGGEPRPEFHNCSGKHAGMLLASVRQGFDVGTYREPGHPVQGAVLEAARAAAGREPDAIGVDGCGVPVHAFPLSALATLFARVATPGMVEGAERAVAAMRAAPHMVAGRHRLCTALMESVPDVVVKVGAEGLVCAGLLAQGVGVAVRIEDGAARASEPAMVRALTLLSVIGGETDGSLARFARPPVLGGGRPVGEVVAAFELTRG